MLYRGNTYDTRCSCPRVTLGNTIMIFREKHITVGVCTKCGALRDQDNKPLVPLAGED